MSSRRESRTSRFLGLRSGDLVSFIGGSPKSLLSLSIARRLASAGRRVLVLPSRPFRPPAGEPPRLIFSPDGPPEHLKALLSEHGVVTLAPGRARGGVLSAFSEEEIRVCIGRAEILFLLAEEDGDPLPEPDPGRRSIPEETTLLVAVAGISALGPELDTVAFADRLVGRGGMLAPETAVFRRVLLLDGADRPSVRADAARVALRVKERLGAGAGDFRIVLTAIRDRIFPLE